MLQNQLTITNQFLEIFIFYINIEIFLCFNTPLL